MNGLYFDENDRAIFDSLLNRGIEILIQSNHYHIATVSHIQYSALFAKIEVDSDQIPEILPLMIAKAQQNVTYFKNVTQLEIWERNIPVDLDLMVKFINCLLNLKSFILKLLLLNERNLNGFQIKKPFQTLECLEITQYPGTISADLLSFITKQFLKIKQFIIGSTGDFESIRLVSTNTWNSMEELALYEDIHYSYLGQFFEWISKFPRLKSLDVTFNSNDDLEINDQLVSSCNETLARMRPLRINTLYLTLDFNLDVKPDLTLLFKNLPYLNFLNVYLCDNHTYSALISSFPHLKRLRYLHIRSVLDSTKYKMLVENLEQLPLIQEVHFFYSEIVDVSLSQLKQNRRLPFLCSFVGMD